MREHPSNRKFTRLAVKTIYGEQGERDLLINICPSCRGSASKFRDELSKKEYSISGLCQSCQDKVFSPMPEERDLD